MPLLPDFMFRMLLWQTVLAGLEYEWSDESDPKFAMMVESYKERVAREPAFGRFLLSSARHFPLEQLQAAYEAAGAADRPTLLVWGHDDRTCPIENAREIQQKYLARAELIVFRCARHFVYTEYVAEVAHALVRFLKKKTVQELPRPRVCRSFSAPQSHRRIEKISPRGPPGAPCRKRAVATPVSPP